MRTVVISQPTYLPWLGYFRIMKEADVYVFLDNVQFERRSWQSRNRIKTPTKCIWLTVPTHHGLQYKISDVEIDNSKPWKRQHWNAIQTSYGKAPYFNNYSSFFKSVYERNWVKLTSLNIQIVRYLASQLGLFPVFVQASKLGLEGKRTRLLLDICKLFEADRYVTSVGAKEYMEKDGAREIFQEGGIKVEFLRFNNPTYRQLFGEFIPDLSFIDCLFNCGPNSSKILFGEGSATFKSLS
ncbi:MAG: WbqC family protein [Promethearchaeota archaeon]